jgi:hypothetical protein
MMSDSFETISETLSNAEFWANYNKCNEELKSAKTVDDVIRICKSYFGKSSGEAFYPGGGDEDLLGTLCDAGWRPAWIRAEYYFGIYEPGGYPDSSKGLHYVEGDIYRGKGKPL